MRVLHGSQEGCGRNLVVMPAGEGTDGTTTCWYKKLVGRVGKGREAGKRLRFHEKATLVGQQQLDYVLK